MDAQRAKRFALFLDPLATLDELLDANKWTDEAATRDGMQPPRSADAKRDRVRTSDASDRMLRLILEDPRLGGIYNEEAESVRQAIVALQGLPIGNIAILNPIVTHEDIQNLWYHWILDRESLRHFGTLSNLYFRFNATRIAGVTQLLDMMAYDALLIHFSWLMRQINFSRVLPTTPGVYRCLKVSLDVMQCCMETLFAQDDRIWDLRQSIALSNEKDVYNVSKWNPSSDMGKKLTETFGQLQLVCSWYEITPSEDNLENIHEQFRNLFTWVEQFGTKQDKISGVAAFARCLARRWNETEPASYLEPLL